MTNEPSKDPILRGLIEREKISAIRRATIYGVNTDGDRAAFILPDTDPLGDFASDPMGVNPAGPDKARLVYQVAIPAGVSLTTAWFSGVVQPNDGSPYGFTQKHSAYLSRDLGKTYVNPELIDNRVTPAPTDPVTGLPTGVRFVDANFYYYPQEITGREMRVVIAKGVTRGKAEATISVSKMDKPDAVADADMLADHGLDTTAVGGKNVGHQIVLGPLYGGDPRDGEDSDPDDSPNAYGQTFNGVVDTDTDAVALTSYRPSAATTVKGAWHSGHEVKHDAVDEAAFIFWRNWSVRPAGYGGRATVTFAYGLDEADAGYVHHHQFAATIAEKVEYTGTATAPYTLAVTDYFGRNDLGTTTYGMAQIGVDVTDPAHGAEASEVWFKSRWAGALTAGFRIGRGLYSPLASGGDPGDGGANFKSLYIDGVLALGVDTMAPATPAGISDPPTQALRTSAGGTQQIVVTWTWTANTEPDLAGYVVAYRRATSGAFVTAKVEDPSFSLQANAGEVLQIKVLAHDWQHNKSAYTSVSPAAGYTVTGDSTAPGVVTVALAPVARPKGVVMKVTAPSSANVGGLALYCAVNGGAAGLVEFKTCKPGKLVKFRDDDPHTVGDSLAYSVASVNLDLVESATKTSLGSAVVFAGIKTADFEAGAVDATALAVGAVDMATNKVTNKKTSNLTDDAALGSTATWTGVSGSGKPADNATKNTTYRQGTAPTGGTYTTGDHWIDTSATPRVHYVWDGAAWEAVGRNTTNTSQVTDGAGLGSTAIWTGVSGSGKPADNATKNTTYRQGAAPTGGTYTTGDHWIDTSATPRVHYVWDGAAWEAVGRNTTNTSQVTDGAGLGSTAIWTGVSGAGKPADNATVGATVGSNLKDPGGTVLNVGDVQNTSATFAARKRWAFKNSFQGFSVNNGSNSLGALYVTVTGTVANQLNLAQSGLSLAGADCFRVRMRVRPKQAVHSWSGRCFYQTAGHSYSSSYMKQIASPPNWAVDEWRTLEWDMSNLTAGGTDWIANTIVGLALELGQTIGDAWDVAWIAVGDDGGDGAGLKGIADGADVTSANYAKGALVDSGAGATTDSPPSYYRALAAAKSSAIRVDEWKNAASVASWPSADGHAALETKVVDTAANGGVIKQALTGVDGTWKRKSKSGDDSTWDTVGYTSTAGWKKLFDQTNPPDAADVTSLGALATKSTIATADINSAAATPSRIGAQRLNGLILDPNFQDSAYWGVTNGGQIVTGSNGAIALGVKSAFQANSTLATDAILQAAASYGNLIPCEAGATYSVSAVTRVTAGFNGVCQVGLQFYKYDGTSCSPAFAIISGTDHTVSPAGLATNEVLTGTFTTPSDCDQIVVVPRVNFSTNYPESHSGIGLIGRMIITRSAAYDDPRIPSLGLTQISTDAAPSLTYGTDGPVVIHRGTLTIARTSNILAGTAVSGKRMKIWRAGGGAFTWTIKDNASANTLATLSTGQGCEVIFDGTNFLRCG